jgi:hypothetical protein
MRSRRLAIVLAIAGLLIAAPAAFAAVILVGDSSGTPTQNVCPGSTRCTYVNYASGVPSDVVPLDGRVVSWQLRSGSVGGRVRLRVLRPLGGGQFQFVASSEIKHVTKLDPDINNFSADIPVKAGDVLALTNVTSGLYMRTIKTSKGLRYFNFDQNQDDGATGAPSVRQPGLHVLLSAAVKSSG